MDRALRIYREEWGKDSDLVGDALIDLIKDELRPWAVCYRPLETEGERETFSESCTGVY